MNKETLQELLTEQIRDLYNAEQQLVRALPKIAKAAESAELADAVTSHLEETKKHVERLTQVFGILGIPAKGKKCKAMEGLLAEGDEVISEEDAGELRDVALIAACQRVEHYEISAYGSAKAIASRLDLEDAVELLQQTENEESQADHTLTEVAGSIYDATDEDDSEPEEENDEGSEDNDEPAELVKAKRAPTKSASSPSRSKKSKSERR